jgi:superfamily I DNA and/or RNA helicase
MWLKRYRESKNADKIISPGWTLAEIEKRGQQIIKASEKRAEEIIKKANQEAKEIIEKAEKQKIEIFAEIEKEKKELEIKEKEVKTKLEEVSKILSEKEEKIKGVEIYTENKRKEIELLEEKLKAKKEEFQKEEDNFKVLKEELIIQLKNLEETKEKLLKEIRNLEEKKKGIEEEIKTKWEEISKILSERERKIKEAEIYLENRKEVIKLLEEKVKRRELELQKREEGLKILEERLLNQKKDWERKKEELLKEINDLEEKKKEKEKELLREIQILEEKKKEREETDKKIAEMLKLADQKYKFIIEEGEKQAMKIVEIEIQRTKEKEENLKKKEEKLKLWEEELKKREEEAIQGGDKIIKELEEKTKKLVPQKLEIKPQKVVKDENLEEEFCEALDEEIKSLKERNREISLYEGKLIREGISGYVYSFRTDFDEYIIPDDTPIKLKIGNKSFDGVFLTGKDDLVFLELEDFIGEKVDYACLIPRLEYLLEALREYLKQLFQEKEKLSLPLKVIGREKINSSYEELYVNKIIEKLKDFSFNECQKKTASLICGSDVSYIWGPPGTGKTTCIGLTTRAIYEKGEKILLLSHSNVAVDMIMSRIYPYFKNEKVINDGLIIRYGTLYLKEKEELKEITIEGILSKKFPDLIKQIEKLQKEKEELMENFKNTDLKKEKKKEGYERLDKIKTELKKLLEEKNRLSKELVKKAEIIGTTLAKTFVSKEILDRQDIDVVIIDEASMTYIPYIFASASLAKKRVAVFGDFRQLPPISQSESEKSKKWLQRDVFDEAGIIEAVEENQYLPYLTLLRIQYRMQPKISEIVNKFIYDGKLEDGESKNNTRRAITQQKTIDYSPYSEKPVILYDTSKLYLECRNISNSRYNFGNAVLSAFISKKIVAKGIEPDLIGIITPYNFQAKLIKNICKDLNINVKVATIHKFQGSEKEIIILDLTDDYPQEKVGRIFLEKESNQGKRLINVAITRAKEKLIILADIDFFLSNLNEENILNKILEFVASKYKRNIKEEINFLLPDFSFAINLIKGDLRKNLEFTHHFQLKNTYYFLKGLPS